MSNDMSKTLKLETPTTISSSSNSVNPDAFSHLYTDGTPIPFTDENALIAALHDLVGVYGQHKDKTEEGQQAFDRATTLLQRINQR